MNRNKYKLTIISLVLLTTALIYMQIQNQNIKSDLPSKLFAGQIHFSRIPVQYWEHRLLMMKSMGLNSLSVYIMWNYHEVQKGKFDYSTGNKNITYFLQLAQKHNMKVLIRPGPYVCAQWDFGGFPARLLSIQGIKLRANNQAYLNQVKIYFESLVPVLKPFLVSNGGPIILLQIQNEYGFYGNDKSYMEALKQMWRNLNFICDQYYVDWVDNILKCHWVGANIGINNGVTQQQWNYVRQFQPQGYLLGGQIYSGWLTHWGQKWQGKSMDQFLKQYNFLLSNNHSFSMYMAHGGSNFGLTAGANSFDGKQYDYGGHITSYDYDAPINEQGAPTPKFYKFKQLASKFADWQIPEPPKPIAMISIPNFIPSAFADLLENLPEATLKNQTNLVAFEDVKLKMWNQGFVLYQTQISQGKHKITLQANDFGLIFLNGQHIKTIDRGESTKTTIQINANLKTNNLRVLVEAMGHINFDHAMETDRKGLISFQSDNKLKFLWNVYKIPVDQDILKWTKKSAKSAYPRLYEYNLTLKQVGDTYLNMDRWIKGYIFVNGINLGRYWNKGPQQKVFCPGVWLKEGVNSVVVLQLLSGQSKFIKGQTTLTVSQNQEIVFKYHSSDFTPVKPKLKID